MCKAGCQLRRDSRIATQACYLKPASNSIVLLWLCNKFKVNCMFQLFQSTFNAHVGNQSGNV